MRAKVDDLHVGQKWSKSISSWENRSWIGMDRMLVGTAWYWSVSAIQWKITISFWRNTRKWGHFPAQIARSGEILTYYWPLVMFSSSPLFQRLCLCRGAPLAPLMLPSEQIGAGQLGPIASREWRKVPCSYWIHIRGYPKMDGADLLSPLSFLCRFKMSPKKTLGCNHLQPQTVQTVGTSGTLQVPRQESLCLRGWPATSVWPSRGRSCTGWNWLVVSDETISRLGPWSFDKEEFSFLKRFQEMSMVLVWLKNPFWIPPKKYDVLSC